MKKPLIERNKQFPTSTEDTYEKLIEESRITHDKIIKSLDDSINGKIAMLEKILKLK